MSKLSARALLCTALLAWSAPAGGNGDEGCLDASVQALQAHYESIRSLEARFEQTSRSVALGSSGRRATVSRGIVHFAVPGRMRWSYEAPEPSLVVSDGAVLWIFDPERREAQRLVVSEGFLSGAALQFLLGKGDLREEFRVRALACEDDAVELELVPRQPASYEKLGVRVERGTGRVVATRVTDLFGNVTEVRFSAMRENPELDPEVFRFVPPDDVQVIELEGPGRSGAGP